MNDPLLMLPDAFKAIRAIHEATTAGGPPNVTRHMVHLRASQINGCSFCAEMHSPALRRAGHRRAADRNRPDQRLERVNVAVRQVAGSYKG
jgi:AhpD family alkylhydroperoxidase